MLKNIKLYYNKVGSGKPLILLHGNQENHHIFDELAFELKDFFTLYMVDSRNHGYSEMTSEFSYDIMADDIISFIEELKIEKPSLLGFSDGGVVGLKIAIKKPYLLSNLIVCGANLSPSCFTKKTLNAMLKAYQEEPSPYLKLMLEEPQIKLKDLNHMKIRTLIIAGQFDVIKKRHTELIHRHIKDSSLIFMKGHDHYNYIVHQDLLKKIIFDYIK